MEPLKFKLLSAHHRPSLLSFIYLYFFLWFCCFVEKKTGLLFALIINVSLPFLLFSKMPLYFFFVCLLTIYKTDHKSSFHDSYSSPCACVHIHTHTHTHTRERERESSLIPTTLGGPPLLLYMQIVVSNYVHWVQKLSLHAKLSSSNRFTGTTLQSCGPTMCISSEDFFTCSGHLTAERKHDAKSSEQ